MIQTTIMFFFADDERGVLAGALADGVLGTGAGVRTICAVRTGDCGAAITGDTGSVSACASDPAVMREVTTRATAQSMRLYIRCKRSAPPQA